MENIEAMLCAFVEGDLDEAGRAQIEKHLESNPQHRKLLNDLVQMKQMVRDLPRAKAPMDVGDSLRQKVERSMLLEDAAVVRPIGKQVDRWPQIFAIAAMFLLVSALCFIVYRALAPTLKPAVFTQTVDRFQSASPQTLDQKLDDISLGSRQAELADKTKSLELKAQAVNPPAAQTTFDAALTPTPAGAPVHSASAQQFAMQQSPTPQNVPQIAAAQPPAAMPPQQNVSQQNVYQEKVSSQNLVQTQPGLMELQKSALAQVDLVAIRRRLQNSGYGVDQIGTKSGGATLVLVNSTDLPATKQQITQFLNNNNGVSWNAVPEDVEGLTQAQALGGFGGAGSNGANNGLNNGQQAAALGGAAGDVGAAMQPMGVNDQVAAKLHAKLGATTEPSSDVSDVYVARGLSAQQVDALRQTLSVPQNGSAVQVEVKSVNDFSAAESPANGPSTTQPSVAMPKDVNLMGAVNSGATSQPSEAANAAADLAVPPTTMPTQYGIAAADRDRSIMSNARTLQPIDAVIVLQPTAAPITTGTAAGAILGNSVSGGGAATQPDVAPAAPATQPETAPTTQP
jgi:hypothetical protein